jgi:hypothetical protein
MKLAQITGINSPSTYFSNSNTFVTDIISRALLFAIPIAGLIFFVNLVMAGFSLLTSTGDPGKIQSATKSLLNSLIGLVIVISVYFILRIIKNIFGLNVF